MNKHRHQTPFKCISLEIDNKATRLKTHYCNYNVRLLENKFEHAAFQFMIKAANINTFPNNATAETLNPTVPNEALVNFAAKKSIPQKLRAQLLRVRADSDSPQV